MMLQANLAKELQGLFRPMSEYSYANHKYRSSPWLQIYNARHMKVDTSEYWSNRTYYSKMYKSMKTAGIPHQDILAVWGNPYIGTVTRWDEISYQRRQNLTQQYSEIEQVAESIAEQKRDFYGKVWWNISNPAKRFLDEYAFAISAIASATPYGRAYSVVRGAVAVAPKLGRLITTLGSVELARQFQILYKKTSGDGLKKGTESNAPRIQNTKGEADEYIKGLTDQKGWVLNRGKTKDGYHYYEVMKKFEYKGITFKRGQYISRDTKHHEIEWFRNKNEHLGAIDPVTGQLKPGKIDYSRRLKIK